ncbi:MAG: hypothetical protein Q9226_009337, partial [Calogaya cf. arnoldii]
MSLEVRQGVPKYFFFTPGGKPKNERAVRDWTELLNQSLSSSEIIFRAATERRRSMNMPLEQRPTKRRFGHHVLHLREEALMGVELMEFHDKLLERDWNIRVDRWPDFMTHYEINGREEARKHKWLAGGKLLEDWEIEALQRCQYERSCGKVEAPQGLFPVDQACIEPSNPPPAYDAAASGATGFAGGIPPNNATSVGCLMLEQQHPPWMNGSK